MCIIHAEWSEQQEDPNIEKLWEEDWDDDQVIGFARSADAHVTAVEPSLPTVRKGVGIADCLVQGIHCCRHDGGMCPTLSFPVCPGDGRLLQSAAGGAKEMNSAARG